MILILSKNNDNSTNHVISWLLYYKAPFQRINEDTHLEFIDYNNTNNFITIKITDQFKEQEIKLNDIRSFWYRRGQTNLSYKKFEKSGQNNLIMTNLELFLKYETQSLEILLKEKFKVISTKIGDEEFNNINKLVVLELAEKSGIDIPKSIITTKKEEVLNFYRCLMLQNLEMISKPINIALNIPTDEGNLMSYTNLITYEDICKMNDVFFPTLFQEKLEKEFELRIFYLLGQTYTMAILSQQDEQTKLDFRNYNHVRPNRTPPFQLPNSIDLKICRFMNKLGLTSGSIDMVYTTCAKFVFLEVNPIGQFGMTSYPTNFYLEKKIADSLINYEKNN